MAQTDVFGATKTARRLDVGGHSTTRYTRLTNQLPPSLPMTDDERAELVADAWEAFEAWFSALPYPLAQERDLARAAWWYGFGLGRMDGYRKGLKEGRR